MRRGNIRSTSTPPKSIGDRLQSPIARARAPIVSDGIVRPSARCGRIPGGRASTTSSPTSCARLFNVPGATLLTLPCLSIVEPLRVRLIRAHVSDPREGQDNSCLNLGLIFPHNYSGYFNATLQTFRLDGKIVHRQNVDADAEHQRPKPRRRHHTNGAKNNSDQVDLAPHGSDRAAWYLTGRQIKPLARTLLDISRTLNHRNHFFRFR